MVILASHAVVEISERIDDYVQTTLWLLPIAIKVYLKS